MLSYSTYTIKLSTTHSSSIITRAVILINGQNRKWSRLGKHWRKLEKDLLAANTCKPKEDTPSSAKEEGVSFKKECSHHRGHTLPAGCHIWHFFFMTHWTESDWPSQRVFAWSKGLRGLCSFPICFPGRAADFTSTAIRPFTGSSSWRWTEQGTSPPTVNTKHRAEQDCFYITLSGLHLHNPFRSIFSI